uniref:Uncharacterized protein n=1 Tax=Macrostomum lignano TaxID=282301 RepID=A0A1I8FC34_9PLAT
MGNKLCGAERDAAGLHQFHGGGGGAGGAATAAGEAADGRASASPAGTRRRTRTCCASGLRCSASGTTNSAGRGCPTMWCRSTSPAWRMAAAGCSRSPRTAGMR